MSWHKEFFNRIQPSFQEEDCIIFGLCPVVNRRLNNPNYCLSYYSRVFNVKDVNIGVGVNKIPLSKHYYHQDMSLVKIMWFNERLTRALELPLHPPLIDIVLEYLLSCH
jgi:hypothetical protein